MKVYTSELLFAEEMIPHLADWQLLDGYPDSHPRHNPNLRSIFLNPSKIYYTSKGGTLWKECYIVKHSVNSLFTRVRQISRNEMPLPDGVILLAGSGDNFIGFRDRPWTASPGNIHLTVHFAPNQSIENFMVGFLCLAAVSVVQTIRKIKNLKEDAGIKWVNDIMLGDAKVGGVLTHTQSKGNRITSALIGIGLNVTTIPQIIPDIFVPRATCIHEFLDEDKKVSVSSILNDLLMNLEQNYQIFCTQGSAHLVQKYRDYSYILGKNIRVYSDPPAGKPEFFAEGTVQKIGDQLELFLDNIPQPITKGRLVLM